MHARAQSTHAITKMHASAESVLKSVHRKLMLRKIALTGNKICVKTFVFSSKVCSVTYRDFLHAHVIHDGTSNIKVSGKFI